MEPEPGQEAQVLAVADTDIADVVAAEQALVGQAQAPVAAAA